MTLIGVVGDDEAAVTLRHKLAAANVRCELIDAEGWPTILKVRVVSRRQQMLRIDFEKPIAADVESRLDDAFREARFPRPTSVVIEDYDKGTLVRPQRYIDIAHEHGKRVVVDPKFKPFEAYRGADVIKPNIAEFTHAVGGWADYRELVSKAAELVRAHDFGALVVTRGDEGMSVIERERRASSRAGARRRRVRRNRRRRYGGGHAGGGARGGLQRARKRDAGESRRRVSSSRSRERRRCRCRSCGANSRLKVMPTAAPQLCRAKNCSKRSKTRVATANASCSRTAASTFCTPVTWRIWRKRGALGDRLVVAVNDDASVARLKGEGRPVNGVAQRMRVLGALASVDWTVSFGEDTPEALLEAIKPDVLVKGGDYRLDEVVGADIVRRYGGEVRVLAHVPNLSTSAILDSLKRPGD